MTFEEFKAFLDQYGANPNSWPEEEAGQARNLMRENADAAAHFQAVSRIEQGLEQPEPDMDLDHAMDAVLDRVSDD